MSKTLNTNDTTLVFLHKPYERSWLTVCLETDALFCFGASSVSCQRQNKPGFRKGITDLIS